MVAVHCSHCHNTTKMHCQRRFVVLLVTCLIAVWDCCNAQTCSVSDIQGIQPNIDLASEKLDGHWFVTHVYNYDVSATGFSSYTVDVVPTTRGLTLYLNKNSSGDTSCEYTAIELRSTSQSLRFSTAGVQNAESRTVIVAAADNNAGHVLFYLCHGDVKEQDLCTRQMALVAGRQSNVTAAGNWVNSVNSSLPCFTQPPVEVQQGAECPLKPFWGVNGRVCDVSTFPVQANFDLNKYISKKWYEMAWLAPAYLDPSVFFTDYEHEYEMQPNGSVVIHVSGRDQTKDECFFTDVLLTRTNTSGQLIFHENNADVPYGVIQTDYDHFAVVFGCANMTSSGTCSNGRGWLWSRDKTLARQYRLTAHSTMQDICLNPAAFFATQHTKECVRDTSGSTSLRSMVVLTVAMLLLVTTFAS